MKFWIPFFNDDNARYEDDEDDESYEPATEAPDVDDFNDDNRGVAGMKQSMNINHCLFASLGFVQSRPANRQGKKVHSNKIGCN